MIGCIIQARMGSSRLPGKVMKKVDEHDTVLDYVINQIKFSKKIDKVIVATTDLVEDDIICEHLMSQEIKFYRGSSEDVLDRYYNCAKKFSIDTIVRITADNPLIDPDIIDLVIDEYTIHDCDFATNTLPRTFPYGTETEVFSFESLENAWKKAKKPSEREHVTPFIRNSENEFKIINKKNQDDFSHIRYTIDHKEDLELVRAIVQNISARPILTQNIVDLYNRKPELFKINSNVKHDGFESSLKKDQQYLKSQKNKEV